VAKKRDSEERLPQLCRDIQTSRLVLRRFREERRDAVREYAGNHWSEEGARHQIPINLLSLYVGLVGKKLVAKAPRVMLSTFDRKNKPTVAAMEKWANKEIVATRLQNTLQRVVIDALFSIGICKVALATPSDSASKAWSLPAGAPFAARVSLDDFVFDTHARDFSEVSFIGHRYRAPLEIVKASKHYSKYRKEIEASTDPLFNQEGDERLSTMGRGYYGDEDEFEPMTDLWEIYLPRHRLVVTLWEDMLTGPTEKGLEGALRVQQWLGRDTGPYHILTYGPVPDQAMGKGPVMDLIDLHMAINNCFRKLIREAQAFKEVGLVTGGATEDGERIIKANDGDMVRVDNPANCTTMKWGGVNNELFMFAVQLIEKFSWLAGNLDMIGGLSPQSKTLGQDKMLEANASASITDMQDHTINFAGEVIKSLCWYWQHDPHKIMRITHSLPGMPELSIERQVGPQHRQAQRFEDLEIAVDPYSMQNATPQSRMAALQQVVQQVVIPMAQMLQSQGVVFDVNAYLQKMAKYNDMPDLSEIVTVQEPPQQEEGGGGTGAEGPGKMPQETTRNYVRENMPGRTEKGNNMNLMNSLMGVNPGGNPKPQNGVPR
jgi:hypothetical protein